MQDNAQITRTGTPASAPEDLPYWIELWHADNPDTVESVLARARNADLARAIFKAAQGEYPERRLTLRKDDRIVSDSSAA
jgi:hypothetical protein